MKQSLRFATAALLCVGSGAVAQTQSQTPTQSAAKASSADDPVVCVKEEDTGSRLSAHKECHTRSEWVQIKRETRTTVEHTQQMRYSQPGH